jgi:hypothetical protein
MNISLSGQNLQPQTLSKCCGLLRTEPRWVRSSLFRLHPAGKRLRLSIKQHEIVTLLCGLGQTTCKEDLSLQMDRSAAISCPVAAASSPSAVRVSHLPAVDNFLVAYQFQENNPCCAEKTAVQRLTAAGAPAGSAVAISFDTDMTGMNVYLGDLAVDASGKALVILYSDRWGLYGAWIEEATQSVTATLLAEYDTVSYARRPAVAFGAGARPLCRSVGADPRLE